MSLTNDNYWDSLYKSNTQPPNNPLPRKRLSRLLRQLLGEKFYRYSLDYDYFLLWEVFLKKILPYDPKIKALEVGSAPGTFLVELHHNFGYIPYGIEKSPEGVALNRHIFKLHQLPSENVIHADFCSPEFIRTYYQSFDLVISRGFIEHFINPEELVKYHVEVLKPGGYLVVSIPNLTGINKFLTHFFYNDLLKMHNLKIMNKQEYKKIFEMINLDPIVCDYYGTFTFNLFNTKTRRIRFVILYLCKIFQKVLNLMFRLFFREKGFESPGLSPFLIFIGRKKESD